MVFPDCAGIRKAVRAVSRMLDGRVRGRLRGRPRYSYNVEPPQKGVHGSVDRDGEQSDEYGELKILLIQMTSSFFCKKKTFFCFSP